MTVLSEDFVIMSFALWAGDYSYLDSLAMKILIDKDKTGRMEKTPESIIYSIGDENLEQYLIKKKKFIREKNAFNEDFLETKNLRARIWQISDFEYCMRGYLKNLDEQKKIFAQIKSNHLDQSKNENQEPSKIDEFGGSWSFKRKENCIVRINEMGLIEVSFFICEPDEAERISKVKYYLSSVLESLDDGP